MISSIVAPASRFSNTRETGMRVSLNTHAPLTFPGMLSTAGHWDQSRLAIIILPFFHRKPFTTIFAEAGVSVQARAPRPTMKGDAYVKPIRILLADDHNIMRNGLRLLLERQPGFQVV